MTAGRPVYRSVLHKQSGFEYDSILVLRRRHEIDASDFLEKEIESGWILKVSLKEQPKSIIKMTGTRHRKILCYPMVSPQVGFTNAGIMEPAEELHQMISASLAFDLVPGRIIHARRSVQIVSAILAPQCQNHKAMLSSLLR